MPGKAPAQTESTGTVATPTAAEKMLLKMAGMATATVGEARSINDLNVILEASDEDFWDSDEKLSINAKMLSGCVIDILGIEVKFGEGSVGDDDIVTPFIDPQSGRQMYLLVTSQIVDKRAQNKLYALPKEHEEFQWNTSARYIVGKLMSAHNRGWLDTTAPPLRVRVVGTPIAGGKKRVEKLKAPDAPFVASTTENGQTEEPPF